MPRTRGNMHHKHMMYVARLHERRGGMLGIALNAGLPPPPAIPVFIPGPPIVHNPNPPLHAHVAHHHGIHGLSTSSHGRYHERRGGESTLFQKFIHKIVHLLHEPRDAQYINEVFNIFQGGPLLYKHTVDVKIGSDMGTTMINTLQTLLTLHGMEENQLVDRLKYTLLKFIPSTTIRPKEGGGKHYPTIQQKSNGMYEVEYKGSILASATNRTEILHKLNSILLQLKFPHHKEDEGEYDFESEVPEFKPRFKLDLLDKR